MKVTYKDHMGSDLTVVNAARVSFGKESDWIYHLNDAGVELSAPTLDKGDQSLIAFLARGCTSGDWEELIDSMIYTTTDLNPFQNKEQFVEYANHIKKMPTHWTPFGHPQISLHFKISLFVAAQLKRHTVGFVINEVSRRYVDDDPEFYTPFVWRGRSEDKKQGSSDYSVEFLRMQGFGEQTVFDGCFKHQMHSLDLYRDMIKAGVAPEQARMILPQSMYTEFWMTGSLYGWANVYNQRSDSHAQKEIQEVAKQIQEIVEPLYPVSWRELTK